MVSIYDGDCKVQEISVMCMFRNDASYIETFFIPIMNSMEKYYDVVFNYYVIENNSVDNTRVILKTFFKEKSSNSKLLLFNLKQDFKNIGNGKNYERLYNLANIRNKLVDTVTPLSSSWCLFVDSNIYFKENILEEMFRHVAPDIGMMTPYTQQLFIPEVHGKLLNLLNLKKPSLLGHYYDTFSFYGKDNKTFWPYCPFEKCVFCNRHECNNRTTIPKGGNVVDVHSCFGGFALIRTEILNNDIVRWETLSHEITNDESLCEHYQFCFLLRKVCGKRVVVLQNVDDIYRTI